MSRLTALDRRRICLAALTTLWLFGASRSTGEIVGDGTLGVNGPIPEVGGTFDILESYGTRSGTNLFHSFERFNLFTGQTALFSGSGAPTENVIVRVTGARSTINGTIAFDDTLGSADLFLLNPYGVAFGTGAHLDLPASFYVSSADVLRFTDGADFSTREISGSVLSMEDPSAFGFIQNDPAQVSLSGDAPLTVSPDATLSVVGGNLLLLPGSMGVAIDSPGSEVQLVGVAGVAEIPIDARQLVASDFAAGALGPVTLLNVGVNVGSSSPVSQSGSVVIRGSRFVLDDGAFLTARHEEASVSEGGIDVEVNGSIEIQDNSSVGATNKGSGEGPDIRLVGREVTISNSEVFVSSCEEEATCGAGRAGELRIEADQVTIGAGGQVLSEAYDEGTGGAIIVRTRDLEVSGAGARIATGTLGLGDGGDIRIEGIDGSPAESIRVTNAAGDGDNARITTFSNGLGDGGSLEISARNIELAGGGQLFAETGGAGDAGSLTIHDADHVTATGGLTPGLRSGITARTRASGDGGLIEIQARTVELSDGAQISTTTLGEGNGGSVRIVDADMVRVDGNGSTIAASSITDSRSGSIFVDSDRVEIVDGGQVSTTAFGGGIAGDVVLEVGDLVVSGSESGIFSGAEQGETGIAGQVTIVADREIVVADGGQINTESNLDTSSGSAGDVELRGGRITIANGSVTTKSANAAGGGISIQAADRVYLFDSSVTSAVRGSTADSDAGNVELSGGRFTVINRSTVVASAIEGDGGSIDVVGGAFVSGDSVLDASSQRGVSGEIVISSPQTALLAGVESLQTDLAQPAPFASNECSARRSRLGSFIVDPVGTVETPPDQQLLPSDAAVPVCPTP